MKNSFYSIVGLLLIAMPVAAHAQSAKLHAVAQQQLMPTTQTPLLLSVQQVKEKVQATMPQAETATTSAPLQQLRKSAAIENDGQGDSILTYLGDMLINVETTIKEGDWYVWTSYDVYSDGSRHGVERFDEMTTDDKHEVIEYLANGDEWRPIRKEVTDYHPLEETDFYRYDNGLWQLTSHYSWTQDISEDGRTIISTQVSTAFDDEGNTICTDIMERTFVDSLKVKEVYIDDMRTLITEFVYDEDGDPLLVTYTLVGVGYYTEEYTYDDDSMTIEYKTEDGLVFERYVYRLEDASEIETREVLDEEGVLVIVSKVTTTYTDEDEISIEQVYSENYGELVNLTMCIEHHEADEFDFYTEIYSVADDGSWERKERAEYHFVDGTLFELTKYFNDSTTPLIIRFYLSNDDTDGIENMTVIDPQQCYDLQGHAIEVPAQGIFIRGGKLCIQK